jgi:predicted RNA-binding Zn-ribbon protein involved in translation (DUF1610 family)
MSEGATRAVPFFCPFCGEESIRPWGDDPDAGHGQWRCEDCTRVFALRLVPGGGTRAGS